MLLIRFLMTLCEKSRATKENHNIVISTISIPIIPLIASGVLGLITRVNKLKKKSVTFGLVALVRKPIRTAENLFKSICFSLSKFLYFACLAVNDLYPMYIRYAALTNLSRLNKTIDFAIMSPIPIREYIT